MGMNYYQYAGIIAIVVAIIGGIRFFLMGPPTAAFVGIPGLGSMMTLYLYVGVVAVLGVVIYMYGNSQQNKSNAGAKK